MTKPLYFYNGTTFELVGPTTPQSPIAYQTSAPTAPATGDLWIDSDGDVDTYNRQLTRYYYVATAGQTSISGVDANGLTLAYVAGSEAVYVNGALQVRGQDYTATNGTSITGLSALAVNDVVEIFAYTAFTVGDIIPKSTIEAKGDLLAGTANTTVGRLAVGTNGQMLVADSSASTGLAWATAGKVLQFVQATSTSAFSTSSGTPVTTGFSASITPTSSSSKILAVFNGRIYNSSAGTETRIEIWRGGASRVSNLTVYNSGAAIAAQQTVLVYDSPATTSSTTYTIYMASGGGTLNPNGGTDGPYSLNLWEIKA